MSAPVPAPVSRGAAWKVVASVAAVCGAVVFMLYSSMAGGAEYYKHVDEVMSDANAWRGKRLKVHGHVVDGSIEQAKGTLQYRFKIESKDPRSHAVISARYTGLVPDTFKSGAEVVASGSLAPDNELNVVADGIMAKCPSKYNADAPKGPVLPGAATAPGAASPAALQPRP